MNYFTFSSFLVSLIAVKGNNFFTLRKSTNRCSKDKLFKAIFFVKLISWVEVKKLRKLFYTFELPDTFKTAMFFLSFDTIYEKDFANCADITNSRQEIGVPQAGYNKLQRFPFFNGFSTSFPSTFTITTSYDIRTSNNIWPWSLRHMRWYLNVYGL